MRWGNVGQNRVAGKRLASCFAPLENLIQFPCVVGDDGIGEQGECAADHDFFVSPASTINTSGTCVDDALELMHGCPADQDSVDAAAVGSGDRKRTLITSRSQSNQRRSLS